MFPWGTHQFIVIAGSLSPTKFGNKTWSPRSLGNVNGFVIGAQNRGKLVVELFQISDEEAAMEYFGGIKTKWFKNDYDTEINLVKFSDDHGTSRVIELIDNYILNQIQSPIKYPTAGLGTNSNSWAQTVIELAGGKVEGDMSGIDVSNDKRIPKTYFEAFCPVRPRPRVN